MRDYADIIKCIPLWEKQYLIDHDVDMVIAARIFEEIDETLYPEYRIIALYVWDTLPFWTLEDSLMITWNEIFFR